MDDFEDQKKKHLNPILFETGAGLLDSQSFEYQIAYLLHLFTKAGIGNLSEAKTTAILEDDEKKTAGQLIGLLKKETPVATDVEELLADALLARNKLVHRVLIDNIERFVDAVEREKLVIEIRGLRKRIRTAYNRLDPLVSIMASSVENLSIEEFSKEAKDAFIDSTQA
ncbi:hypothetical protein HR45_00625 [Shewanella mangrovi]|uniref:Uncharacterized protein n=1 Tax=Shewanella mangrovi TaxID=1515746 RepID=A0A094JID1_9GAMM|nr:hypothetical protein [Shewanella mangrovi]KFZ38942.1 hypothetical protein HR45_00625 [Shewanella mangrovi]